MPSCIVDACVLAFTGLLSSFASVLSPRDLKSVVLGDHIGVLRDWRDPQSCPRALVDLMRCSFVTRDAGGRFMRVRTEIQTQTMHVIMSLSHEKDFHMWLQASHEDAREWRPWEFAASYEIMHAISECLLPDKDGDGAPNAASITVRRAAAVDATVGASAPFSLARCRPNVGALHRLELASLCVDFLGHLSRAREAINDLAAPTISAIAKLYRPVPGPGDDGGADAGADDVDSASAAQAAGSAFVRNIFVLMDDVRAIIESATSASEGRSFEQARTAAVVLQHSLMFMCDIVNLMNDTGVGKLDFTESSFDICGEHSSDVLTKVTNAMNGVRSLRYYASTSHYRRCGALFSGHSDGALVDSASRIGADVPMIDAGGFGGDDDATVGRLAEEVYDGLNELQESIEILQPLSSGS